MATSTVTYRTIVDTKSWTLPTLTASAPPPLEIPLAKPSPSAYLAPDLLTGHREPCEYSGSLDQFKQFDYVPSFGREFTDANLVEWLRAPNSDQLIKDLAITVARRGCVFFRAQNDLTNELQKELAQRMGLLTGKPKTSGLHVFPIMHTTKQLDDKELTVITHEDNRNDKSGSKHRMQDAKVIPLNGMWHSDVTFEHVPSDYAVLKMTKIPRTGGDTVWASTYELYDRLSRPIQAFLETLTFTGGQPKYHKMAKSEGIGYYTEPRGAPENVGEFNRAVHPVVRTNPVTGWKALYCLGHHVEFLNGVTSAESEHWLGWLNEAIWKNHDNHVRFRWQNENDIAIWDNRCMVHTATPDYLDVPGLGDRQAVRALSIGERPYFDPASTGRTEALEKES